MQVPSQIVPIIERIRRHESVMNGIFFEKFPSKRNETKTIKNRKIFSLSWRGTFGAVTGCGNQLHLVAIVTRRLLLLLKVSY